MVAEGMVLPLASIHRLVSALEREDEVLGSPGASSGSEHRARAARRESLRPLEGWKDWMLVRRDGPLWTRSAARWDEGARADTMKALLEAAGVHRLVIGHTPQDNGRIRTRFDGSVILVDTKMYAVPRGKGGLSALELKDGSVVAIYPEGREVLVAAGTGDQAVLTTSAAGSSLGVWAGVLRDVEGEPLPFTSEDQVLEYLRAAEVVSMKDVGRGVTNPKKLTLSRDGLRAHAIFRDVSIEKKNVARTHRKAYLHFRDYHGFEVAAYELSRLLGVHRVPPAVLREVDGRKGSVQIWLEDMIMDVDRRDLGLVPPEPHRWQEQRQILDIFDNIIGNSDRNLGNVLIDRSWNLWFIDHSRCFVTAKALLFPERVTHCERGLWRALQGIDEALLVERLDPLLSPFELETVLDRVSAMREHIGELITEHGEDSVLFDLEPASHPPVEWPER
jgi:hypothetical protein